MDKVNFTKQALGLGVLQDIKDINNTSITTTQISARDGGVNPSTGGITKFTIK